MDKVKWNRRPKRDLAKDDDISHKFSGEDIYKVSRVRPKRKKRKHPGFTITPEHRLWVFENNKLTGGNK